MALIMPLHRNKRQVATAGHRLWINREVVRFKRGNGHSSPALPIRRHNLSTDAAFCHQPVKKADSERDSGPIIGRARVKLLAKAAALPKAALSADQQTTTILFL